MPLSCPVDPKTDSLFYATHNNHRLLCLNDLNFMPENHALFSSPLPRTNDFYPAAYGPLSNAINVPPNGYVWSNCSCYLGTHVRKMFSLTDQRLWLQWPPLTPLNPLNPTTSGEHFLTSVFVCVEWFLKCTAKSYRGLRGRDGEILMSALQEPHCRGMRWECVDAPKSVQLLLSQP